jgi:hypothetical protein
VSVNNVDIRLNVNSFVVTNFKSMSISYVKRKIGQSYLVWLQNANLYFLLEEPAWYVFSRVAKRYKTETIARDFSHRYSVDLVESLTFVRDIRARTEKMNQMKAWAEGNFQVGFDISNFRNPCFSSAYYTLGTKVIRFTYGNELLERYIRPLIRHLETTTNEATAHFELFEYQDDVVFRLNNEIVDVWTKQESHLVKGRVFIELVNILHNKTNKDWLMTVHAAAVTNEKKTILFSASPGSGKSTFSALLQARGFHLISDDFVPFAKDSLNAYPFPVAMSVKEGAMELLKNYYPELEGQPLTQVTPEKKVRHIPIANEKMDLLFPVAEIVFIKYDQAVEFELEELDLTQGLRLLLQQIWVPPKPENVEILFDKLERLSFLQLTYSDTERALKTIENVFAHE